MIFVKIKLAYAINPDGFESYISIKDIKALFYAQNSWNVLVSDSVFSIEEFSATKIEAILKDINSKPKEMTVSDFIDQYGVEE